jgi:hypothetical protein
MGSIRRFALLALATVLAGCASFSQWLDKLEGKEPQPANTRSTAAATPKATPKPPAAPPAKPAPPPPTWSTTLPTGTRITFGRAESFAAVEDHAVDVLTSELCGVGWTRQFGNYPSIYFVEIDNRKGKADVSWSPRDRVVLAAQGRTYEQEQGFRFAAVMQRFGGHAQTVLPGTTAIMPVVFVNPVPWRSITTARIQSGSTAIPLACDEQPISSATTTAAPAR